ncbi:hypothetical protein ACJJTC_000228 [Scirpophaga incertulas]
MASGLIQFAFVLASGIINIMPNEVHTRLTYLRHLIVSLAQARDIDRTLLIFSHDYYDEEINNLVRSIDFTKTDKESVSSTFQNTFLWGFLWQFAHDCMPPHLHLLAVEMGSINIYGRANHCRPVKHCNHMHPSQNQHRCVNH